MIYQIDGDNGYGRFSYNGNRNTRNPSFIRTTRGATLPEDSIPTTIYGNRNMVQHTGTRPQVLELPVREFEWWGIVVESTLWIQDLVIAILQGSAVAVTDGSYKDHLGTAAYTFQASITDNRKITMVMTTPGMPTDITAYLAEVGGLYGIATFLQWLHKRHDVSKGSITVGCDCKGALSKAMSSYIPKPKQPDYDLFLEIHRSRINTPVTWIAKWIKGHQDDLCQDHTLDGWATLNIHMDLMAKEHWHRVQIHGYTPFSLPPSDNVWSLWGNGQRICHWDKNIADQLYYNHEAAIYWGKKHKHFDEMDYDSICLAYRSLSLYYQLRVPKWIGHRLSVQSKLSMWFPDTTPNCPRCNNNEETHAHVITCQHPGAIALVNKWLDEMEIWLVRQRTHPDIRYGVLSLLKAAFRSMEWVTPRTSEPEIRMAFQNQRRQGTEKVMFGWWAIGWAEAQNNYLLSIERRTTGRCWLSRLIKKQWEIAWDLWRHRMEVSHKPDSFSVVHAHDQINIQIRTLFIHMENRTEQTDLYDGGSDNLYHGYCNNI